MKSKRRRAAAGLLAAVLAVGLAGCYLPRDFTAVVRIGRSGAYWLEYDGTLTRVPLYKDIRRGEISGDAREKRIRQAADSLRNIPGFEEVAHTRNGTFEVKYRFQGRLRGADMVTFVRRNARVFSVKSDENGRVTVSGVSLSKQRRKRLKNLALDMEGTFGVVTDADVKKHNADEVRQRDQGVRAYVWHIESMADPSPNLVLQLP